MNRVARKVAKGVVIAIAVVAFLVAFGWVVMLLWNSLVPELFHGPTLRYWQALGLLVLSRILFGGIRGHGGHGRWRRHLHERMHENWEAMTPEERARLRERVFEQRCGRGARSPEGAPPA